MTADQAGQVIVKKRRPTATDRDLADILLKLRFGTYKITVENKSTAAMQFMGLAELKIEGSVVIDLDTKKIRIVPQ